MARLFHGARVPVVGSLAVVLLAAPTGLGYVAYRHDMSARTLLPDGTTVGGVDVSRLGRAAAIDVVTATIGRDLDRAAVLDVAGRRFTVTPRRLGSRADVAGAVDRAFAAARHGHWLPRSWHRFRGDRSGLDVPVTVTEPTETALKAFAARVATTVAVPPRDGTIDVANGFLSFRPAVAGARLDPDSAVEALRGALDDGAPRQVELEPVAPTTSVPRTALLIRTGENKLYVYRDGRIIRTYGVATGSARYPTPRGTYSVTLKRYRPTWVNPWSKWSMHMPAFIRPGPSNPLGTRALNISAPGIRIHGTPADSSIGYSVSHGCVRMHMPDVEALYEIVEVGTPVVIVRAAPPRPMPRRGSAPAPTPAPAEGG